MRVLYVCADLGVPVLGEKGAAVHVRAMASAMAHAGHTVRLAAATLTKSPWRPADHPSGVQVLHLPPGPETVAATSRLRAFADSISASRAAGSEVRRVLYNQELLAALDRMFAHDPPDVVYERASLFGTAGLQFARQHGLPHLLELNAPLADEHRRYRHGGALQDLADASEGWLLTHSDAVLAVSAPLAAHVRRLGVESARVHVVPNGIDPVRFAPGPRDRTRSAALDLVPGPVLGFVGGLRPWHGADVIPALVDALRPEFPGVRALVVGDGPLGVSMAQDVQARGLNTHIRFLGSVAHQDVAGLIRECDLALAPYPATNEPFYFSPLKIFEYMACGVPVVAADVGQLADVVQHGETGLRYSPGNLDALVACCRHLLRAPDTQARMGAAGRARVLASFTWTRNVARVEEIARAIQSVDSRPAVVA